MVDTLFKKGTFTKKTSTGTQDITDVGFQPKAVILWTNQSTVETFTEHCSVSYGFSDGTSDMVVCSASEDNQATSDSRGVVYDDAIMLILDGAAFTNVGQATLDSFLVNGFRLNWSVANATGYVIHYIAIGGSDITNVKAGTKNVTATGTGNQAYTGVGFQPDFMITANYGISSITAPQSTPVNHAGIGLSAMKSSSARWALTTCSENGRTTMDTWRYQRTDKCYTMLINSTGALDVEADFVSFDSDGWTWNYTAFPGGAAAAADDFIYLAFKGGTWDVGNATAPTSNTTTTINTDSVATFKGIQLASVQNTANSSIVAHNALAIGGCDSSNNQGVITYYDTDAAADSIIAKRQNDNNCMYMMVANATATSSTVLDVGTGTAAAHSLGIAWTNTDASARQFVYWALSEPLSQVSTTKTHKYNTIAQVVATKTHKYNTIGKVTATKTHKFNNSTYTFIKTNVESTDLDLALGTITRQFTTIPGSDSNFQITVPVSPDSIVPTFVTEPNVILDKLNWENGNWTVKVRITAVETPGHPQIITILLYRLANIDGSWVPVAFNVLEPFTTINSTGVYTFTLTNWNDGSQNAQEERTSNDRIGLEIDIVGLTGTPSTINIGVNLTNGNDEVISPLILPTTFTTTKTHKWNTIGQVTASKTHKWNTIVSFTTTKTHKYDTLALVSTTKTHKYNVEVEELTQVEAEKTHKYNVIGLVETTKTHKYNTIGLVEATKTHKYNTIATVSTTKTHKYNTLVSVSTTKTHKYNTLVAASTTKTHKYHVTIAATATKTHKYNIIGLVEVTKTHKWNTLALITVTKSHLWNTIGRITVTKTHIYSTLQSIPETLKTHVYNVAIAADTTKTHKYNVIGLVEATKTHKYDTIARVEAFRTHVYVMEGRVLALRTHKFHTVNAIGETLKTHKYDVLQAIGETTKTHKFDTLELVEVEKTHIYDVGGSVTAFKTHKWNTIAPIPPVTKAHLYNVIALVETTKTHKYDILEQIEATKTHIWNTLARVTATKTHRYDVESDLEPIEETLKTHKYNILQRVQVTKTHKFDVESEIQLPVGGGSTTYYINIPPEHKILDVISSIDNIAVANVEIYPVIENTATANIEISEFIDETKRFANHRFAKTVSLVLPPIIEEIRQRAVSLIALEIVEANTKRIAVQSKLQIDRINFSQSLVGHLELVKGKDYLIASKTEIRNEKIPILLSANIELRRGIPTMRVATEEIMSHEEYNTYKNIIDILNNDILLE